MTSTHVSLVHDPDITGLKTTILVGHFNDFLNGKLHVSQENGQPIATLCNRLTGNGMKDAVSTIIGLGNDGRYRGVNKMQIHFIGYLLKAAAYNRQRYWIHSHFTFTSKFPRSSTDAFMSGSITVVVSVCSTMAGPLNDIPGPRSLRW